MIALESLTAFVFASLLLCTMPGPDNLFVLSQSALYGMRSGLLVTLGLCTGLLVHTTIVALGLAVVIQSSTYALQIIKLFGATYLLYLAWLAFRAEPVGEAGAGAALSAGAMYRRGVIMNLSNPKVSLFFLAFLPQFANPEYGALAPQMFLLGAVFLVVTLLTFSVLSVVSGVLSSYLRRHKNAELYLNRAAGVLLSVLALALFGSSV